MVPAGSRSRSRPDSPRKAKHRSTRRDASSVKRRATRRTTGAHSEASPLTATRALASSTRSSPSMHAAPTESARLPPETSRKSRSSPFRCARPSRCSHAGMSRSSRVRQRSRWPDWLSPTDRKRQEQRGEHRKGDEYGFAAAQRNDNSRQDPEQRHGHDDGGIQQHAPEQWAQLARVGDGQGPWDRENDVVVVPGIRRDDKAERHREAQDGGVVGTSPTDQNDDGHEKQGDHHDRERPRTGEIPDRRAVRDRAAEHGRAADELEDPARAQQLTESRQREHRRCRAADEPPAASEDGEAERGRGEPNSGLRLHRQKPGRDPSGPISFRAHRQRRSRGEREDERGELSLQHVPNEGLRADDEPRDERPRDPALPGELPGPVDAEDGRHDGEGGPESRRHGKWKRAERREGDRRPGRVGQSLPAAVERPRLRGWDRQNSRHELLRVVRIAATRDDPPGGPEAVEILFVVPTVDAGGEETAHQREHHQQSHVRHQAESLRSQDQADYDVLGAPLTRRVPHRIASARSTTVSIGTTTDRDSVPRSVATAASTQTSGAATITVDIVSTRLSSGRNCLALPMIMVHGIARAT